MSSKSIAMLGLVGLSLAGCKETIGSEHIRTGGIAMVTEVIASSESRTRVRTELLAGGDESNTGVNLHRSDRLMASGWPIPSAPSMPTRIGATPTCGW